VQWKTAVSSNSNGQRVQAFDGSSSDQVTIVLP